MKQKIMLHNKLLTTTTAILTTAVAVVNADEYTHRYKKGDRVDLWVNKVRSFYCVSCTNN